MGFQDRDYAEGGYQPPSGPTMGGGFLAPTITPTVKKLLIANAAVFVAQIIFQKSHTIENIGAFVFDWAVLKAQVWRFVTYQYLHGNFGHILWNMVALFFLGALLERRWGPRKFFILYTIFGIAGAAAYSLLVAFGLLSRQAWMIGASGSILGLVGACAVIAPNMRVLLFFIIPIRIRTLTIAIAVLYTLNVWNLQNGADACHLGGLALGALWAYLEVRGFIRYSSTPAGTVGPSGRKWVQVKIRKGAWDIKMKRKQAQQAQIDRILQKVHQKGLNSLTRTEKKILQQASKNRP